MQRKWIQVHYLPLDRLMLTRFVPSLVLNIFESQIVFNFFLRISIPFLYLNLNFRSQILFKLNSCTCLQPEKCVCTNTSSVIHTLAKIFNNNNSSTTHITLSRGQVDVRLFILFSYGFYFVVFQIKNDLHFFIIVWFSPLNREICAIYDAWLRDYKIILRFSGIDAIAFINVKFPFISKKYCVWLKNIELGSRQIFTMNGQKSNGWLIFPLNLFHQRRELNLFLDIIFKAI